MFTQLGLWVSLFLDGYVLRIVTTLTTGLVGIALAWLTVYIGLYGYAVARGEASDSLQTFLWKMVKMSFIFTFSLSSQYYMDVVYATANGWQDSMAAVFVSGPQFDDALPTTVYGSLDTANEKADELLKEIWKDAGIMRLDLVIASIAVAAGTVLFLVCGTIVIIISKVLAAFVLAIGPMAILALMFKQTAKFFDSWLATLMSTVVISWFVFYALGFSLYVVEKLLQTLASSGAFAGSGTVNALTAAFTYVAFTAILAYLLWHSPQYASSLTGGAAVQHGGNLLSSYFGSKAGSSSSGGQQPNAGGGENQISAGGGASYRAGQMAGSAAATAGRAALNVAAAGGAAAVAAYRRVAKRSSTRY